MTPTTTPPAATRSPSRSTVSSHWSPSAWWRRESACRGARLVPVGANGAPAVAQYRRAADGTFEPFILVVLDVAGGRIASIHAFIDPPLVALFA